MSTKKSSRSKKSSIAPISPEQTVLSKISMVVVVGLAAPIMALAILHMLFGSRVYNDTGLQLLLAPVVVGPLLITESQIIRILRGKNELAQ